MSNLTIAFIRDMPGYSAAQQQKDAERHGATKYYTAQQETKARDAWISTLRRGDVAVIGRLLLLAEPYSKAGPRPTRDFLEAMTRLLVAGVKIVEAESGITSDQPNAFVKAVGRAADRIATGRHLSARRARKIGMAGVKAAIERSPVRRWLSKDMEKDRKRFGAVWRDPKYPNDAAAAFAVNEELVEDGKPELGSSATMRRIFGRRQPGTPSAGGRPPKRKK